MIGSAGVSRAFLWLWPLAFAVASSLWMGYLAATDPDRLLGFVPDDAFYYFGVAEHLREGWWFSFDGITMTNGFHPLWALVITPVLAVAGHKFVYVLVAGAILSALAIALLARCVEQLWDSRVAVAFSVLMALNPVVLTHAVNGLETGLLMFTTSLLLWQGFVRGVGSSREAIRLGVITAAVCLSRTDAAFLAVLVWLGILVGHRQQPLLALRLLARAGVVAALIIAPWFIYNVVVFGSVMQDSGRAFVVMEQRYHAFHGSLDVLAARPAAVLTASLGTLGDRLGLVHQLGLGIAGVLGAIAFWRHGVTPARAGLVATLLAYGAAILLGGAWRLVIREWYLAPIIALSMLLLALVVSLLPRRSVACAAALIIGLGLSVEGRDVLARGPWPDQAAEPARIRVVAANLPSDAVVGNSDAGMWGWFAPFTTVNLDGLANSEVLPAIEHGRMLDYIRGRGMDGFFFGRPWWKQPWLMGPGSGLLYEDVTLAGEDPAGRRFTMSRVLAQNSDVVARFARESIDTTDADFARWLGGGWAVPPAPGPAEVWSIASSSDLYLPVPTDRETGVTMWLNAIGSPERRTRIRVSVDGRPTGEIEVANAAAHQPFTVMVPRSGGLLATIRLEYDQTWKPSALGQSADSRDLAVSIVRITTAPAGLR
jgi:hypothetical protein